MNSQDWFGWVGVLAALVAIYATVAGEIRAVRTRRGANERHIVEWRLRWSGNTVIFENLGPDTAREVRGWVRYGGARYESRLAKTVGVGERLAVEVPKLGIMYEVYAMSRASSRLVPMAEIDADMVWATRRKRQMASAWKGHQLIPE